MSRAGLPLALGIAAIAAFHVVGWACFDRWTLDLGSVRAPTPGYRRFILVWTLFGSVAAIALASAILRVGEDSGPARRLTGRIFSLNHRLWVLAGVAAAFAIPLATRGLVLDGAALTDDESCYLFMAQLLASGRLYAESPPMKLFFDRAYMINDGRLYSQYFIGWPALLVPGVWLGHPGVMNPLYASLTVPALFGVLRHITDAKWARFGILLYLGSPMLMIGAATLMSHTSCLMALAWASLFLLQAGKSKARPSIHALAAFFVGMAFFIRPGSALGILTPLLLRWVWCVRRNSERRLANVVSFALPGIVLGGLFLLVNRLQTGSFTTVAYVRLAEYVKENGYRFSNFEAWYTSPRIEVGGRTVTVPVPNLGVAYDQPVTMLIENVLIALLRLNWDVFGWPSSFLFAAFAGIRGHSHVWWESIALFFATHLFMFDSGIDSFGPVHYFETAWPLLILTVLGVRALNQDPAKVASKQWLHLLGSRLQSRHLAPALAIGFVVSATGSYLPVRLQALRRIASSVNAPRDVARTAGLENAIVFASRPWAHFCRSHPVEHFVNWWPNNDPDFANGLLWANHISIEQDRRLMAHFPGRTGYAMVWTEDCEVRFVPLHSPAAQLVPDGFIGGSGEGPGERG